MIKTSDIHWLAGLLEGEGCFGVVRNRPKDKPGVRTYPRITLGMCDNDVVLRAQKLMGGTLSQRPAKENRKPVLTLSIQRQALAAGWMMTLYPLMGARRQEKIRTLLEQWRQS